MKTMLSKITQMLYAIQNDTENRICEQQQG